MGDPARVRRPGNGRGPHGPARPRPEGDARRPERLRAAGRPGEQGQARRGIRDGHRPARGAAQRGGTTCPTATTGA
ncbi:hypothetical protein ACRAWF_24660 [Streptomyces sp. L7]